MERVYSNHTAFPSVDVHNTLVAFCIGYIQSISDLPSTSAVSCTLSPSFLCSLFCVQSAHPTFGSRQSVPMPLPPRLCLYYTGSLHHFSRTPFHHPPYLCQCVSLSPSPPVLLFFSALPHDSLPIPSFILPPPFPVTPNVCHSASRQCLPLRYSTLICPVSHVYLLFVVHVRLISEVEINKVVVSEALLVKSSCLT